VEPVAASENVYVEFTVTDGSDVVVTTGTDGEAALTTKGSVILALPAIFVAVNVIDPELELVGVPERTPSLKLINSPLGRVPAVTDHSIGVEPEAAN
jgi:hypothetical protein